MLPLKDLSSPVTPATPEAPCRDAYASSVNRASGATFVNRLGHLRHVATQDVGEPGSERTQRAHRIDAVADDEFPGRILLQSQAIDFVSRESSDFGFFEAGRVLHRSRRGRCRLHRYRRVIGYPSVQQ